LFGSFPKLKDFLQKTDIMNIYNIDVKGCRLTYTIRLVSSKYPALI